MTNAKQTRKTATCATIGCRNKATHEITYTGALGREEPYRDLVCRPCGESYARRPALKAAIREISN